jgi:SRSO17 transposase
VDEGSFRQVAGALRAFHRRFAPLFGRTEARRHGAQYVRGLLVTREERRNAENLAETVVGSAERDSRALQQFLTDSPWRPEAVVAELQRYLGEELLPQDPQEAREGVATDGVFTLDSTGFAKRGTGSAGVARQYSGTLGKVDNCQIGVFVGYATARGHALIDGQLWLPREWTDDPARCRRARVPDAVVQAGYASQAAVGLALLRRARDVGALPGRWVTADEAFGQVPTFRDALDADGWWYVAEVPTTTPVFVGQARTRQVRLGRGTPPRPVAVQPAAQTVQAVAAALPARRWTTVTVAQGAKGPRTHRFAALRVWESRDGVPGRDCWLVLRQNLDGSEPKYFLSNAPADTPLATLARVGAVRWTVETEFQTSKGLVGLDEYEVRSWPGWHHHITLCLLANAFLLSLQRAWVGAGEKGARGRTAPSADETDDYRHASRDPRALFARPRPPGPRPTPRPLRHPRPGRAGAPRPATTPPLDPGRPATVARRHPAPQRPRHRVTRVPPPPSAT